MTTGATFQECLDELLALASHAGMLGSQAISLEALAEGCRDPRVKRRARQARASATIAERLLNGARSRFLARWSSQHTTENTK